MNRIIHHSPRMTAIPTDLLLAPDISIEAKAVAGILQALDEGDYGLRQLALCLNIPEEKILPVLRELTAIGVVTIEKEDGDLLLHVR